MLKLLYLFIEIPKNTSRPIGALSPGLLLSPEREDEVDMTESKTQDYLGSNVYKGVPKLVTEVEQDDGKATVHTNDYCHDDFHDDCRDRYMAVKVECDINEEVKIRVQRLQISQKHISLNFILTHAWVLVLFHVHF